MGLFSKEEKTKFIRNKAGEVVKVERTESKPRFKRKSRTPISKALEKEYYRKHPTETKTYKAKKAGRNLLNAFDEMADNYAKNTKKRSKGTSSRSKTQYIVRGGKAYPVAKPPKKKPGGSRYSSYDFTGNYNPFGDMFDTGINKSKKKRKGKGFDPFDNYGFF